MWLFFNNKLDKFIIKLTVLKAKVTNAQTHHFPIVLLYFTIIYAFDVICIDCVCIGEMGYNGVLLHHVASLKWEEYLHHGNQQMLKIRPLSHYLLPVRGQRFNMYQLTYCMFPGHPAIYQPWYLHNGISVVNILSALTTLRAPSVQTCISYPCSKHTLNT